MISSYFDNSVPARTLVCISEAEVPVSGSQVGGRMTQADESMHEIHIDVEMRA
jgi:hypothetical protein